MPTLVMVQGPDKGAELELEETNILGRKEGSATILIDDPAASRHHARVWCEEGNWLIEDLGSTNGTFVDRDRITERILLVDGSMIKIGKCLMVFRDGPLVEASLESGVFIMRDEVLDAVKMSETAALRERLSLLHARLTIVDEISTAIMRVSLQNLDHLLEEILSKLMKVFPQAQRGVIMLAEGEDAELVERQFKSKSDNALTPRVSRSVSNEALATGKALLCEDVGSDTRFRDSVVFSQIDVRSLICAPMRREDKELGVIYLDTDLSSDPFTEDDLLLLAAIGVEAALAVENAQLIGDLRRKNTELENTLSQLKESLAKINLLETIKDQMSKFMPRSVVERIERRPESPDFDQRDEDVSVLFLDIAGYTRMNEKLGSGDVSFVVETYFSRFLAFIHSNHGEVNEIAGDGLMIIFRDSGDGNPQGAEDTAHAVRAIRTAIAIRDEAHCVNEELKATAELRGKFDPVEVHIGVNSGIALVGSRQFESPTGTRLTYTASGPMTNLAARIGAIATGGAILIGKETAKRIEQRKEFRLEPLGSKRFKNINEPVDIYEVFPSEVGVESLDSIDRSERKIYASDSTIEYSPRDE